MNILFITDKVTFPPKDGIELPNSKIMEGLSNDHNIYILRPFVNKEEKGQVEDQLREPSFIKDSFWVQIKLDSSLKRIADELTIQKPFYFIDKIVQDKDLASFGKINFDWIWVSPVGYLGIAELIKNKYNPKVKIAVGINEPQYTVYEKKWLNLKNGHESISKDVIEKILRLPFVKLNEKKYLKRCDLIHVQTDLEKRRVGKLLGKEHLSKVVVAPNGTKQELLDFKYQNPESKTLLFMTQMDESRGEQIDYFFNKVWLPLLELHPDLKLHLVGKPPSKEKRIRLEKIPGVKVIGFVDQLMNAFENISICLIPVFQHHGLINRVNDALCAGIPVVGFEAVMDTVDHLEHGIHGYKAKNGEEMVHYISELLKNPEARLKMASSAKALAQARNTWQDSVKLISEHLLT